MKLISEETRKIMAEVIERLSKGGVRPPSKFHCELPPRPFTARNFSRNPPGIYPQDKESPWIQFL